MIKINAMQIKRLNSEGKIYLVQVIIYTRKCRYFIFRNNVKRLLLTMETKT